MNGCNIKFTKGETYKIVSVELIEYSNSSRQTIIIDDGLGHEIPFYLQLDGVSNGNSSYNFNDFFYNYAESRDIKLNGLLPDDIS